MATKQSKYLIEKRLALIAAKKLQLDETEFKLKENLAKILEAKKGKIDLVVHEDQPRFEKCLVEACYKALHKTNEFWVDDLTTTFGIDLAEKRFNGSAYGLTFQQNLGQYLAESMPEFREEDRSVSIEPDIVHVHDILKSFEVKCTIGTYNKTTKKWVYPHSYKMPAKNKLPVENYILVKVFDPFRYDVEPVRATFREISIAKYEHNIFKSAGMRNEASITAADRNERRKVLCQNEIRKNDTKLAVMTLPTALNQLGV